MPAVLIRAIVLSLVASALTSTTAAETERGPVTLRITAEIRQLLSANGLAITGFYEPDFLPAWVRGGKATVQAVAIIGAMKDAASKGLSAEEYDAAQWQQRLDSLRAATPRDIALFDVTLTECLVRYASDLEFGRLPKAGTDAVLPELVAWLRERLPNSSDPILQLNGLEPPFPGYRRTLEALQHYRVLASQNDRELLPAVLRPARPGPAKPAPIKPGDTWSGIPRLARLLQLLGDLPAHATASLDVYQEPLVSAVSRYQQRHGLDSDGRIGPTTIASLNTPLTRRVRQLELTLERWREAPRSFSRPPIVVNIPEFTLHALNEKYGTELQMKVVAGKAYGHQTPVFMAEMKYVIFRPYWDVPISIVRRELLPHLQKDAGYLVRNHYEVVNRAEDVVTGDVAGSDFTDRLASGVYRIRQTPGKDNALGGVKFMFPNEHDIYLHGTPAVELFSKTRRDFSHGCIRVEKPEELARWVLRGKKEWTPERIHAAMNGDKPVRVDLDQPIPVLIVYGTAVVAENGEVFFLDDIYGLDAKLEKTLSVSRQF